MAAGIVVPFTINDEIIDDLELQNTDPINTSTEATAIRICYIAEYSQQKLNDIHSHLWSAGNKDNINALHHQKVLCREVVLSERSDLHLVWFDRIIYIKPLTISFLNYNFIDTIVLPDAGLYSNVLGFLYSYMMLIRYASDLSLAHELGLISKKVEWKAWRQFRTAFLGNFSSCHMNKRFRYDSQHDQIRDMILSKSLTTAQMVDIAGCSTRSRSNTTPSWPSRGQMNLSKFPIVSVANYFVNFCEEAGRDASASSDIFAAAQGLYAFNRFVAGELMTFKSVTHRYILAIYLFLSWLFVLAASQSHGTGSIACLVLVLCAESAAFSTTFTLGLRGLGRHTKLGGALIVAAISGGAVFPLMTGAVVMHL
ncbi:hypothetical protein ACMFMG_000538 [Clarireedia jacksonii]